MEKIFDGSFKYGTGKNVSEETVQIEYIKCKE